MDFPLDQPIPRDTVIAGALVYIYGLDPDGNGCWYVRTSGEPGTMLERIGLLTIELRSITDDAVNTWITEPDEEP